MPVAEATRLMGVSTKEETANGALRDYVAASAWRPQGRRPRGASSRLRRMRRPRTPGGEP
ncbi:type II toxin-antitoxin system VapB family antitoxin [Streptomyces sp. NBC_01335]|uniref:type II toxin-antitoxin system VapB family antitoxin n=1 Tax=Streptomyces sp. NBC_01335 TaxID=2903828 RepID=UPI003FA3C8F6